MFTVHFLSFLTRFDALGPLRSLSKSSNGRYLKRLVWMFVQKNIISISSVARGPAPYIPTKFRSFFSTQNVDTIVNETSVTAPRFAVVDLCLAKYFV